MQRRRGVECNFRQRGDRCQHLGERRAPGQVAGERMHEEAAPQHPQGRREGDAVATFDDRREGVTRGGPVERHVQRRCGLPGERRVRDQRVARIAAPVERLLEVHGVVG